MISLCRRVSGEGLGWLAGRPCPPASLHYAFSRMSLGSEQKVTDFMSDGRTEHLRQKGITVERDPRPQEEDDLFGPNTASKLTKFHERKSASLSVFEISIT